ncbi:MAG: Fpg/Nei family DNA glycosylase [Calditrichaeota bacterium]|nr:Fpg/Nei family DNA glycosylase [Calditrichota bacterium]
MPELPEIVVIATQMDETLRGKTVSDVEIFQPKCLNRAVADCRKYLPGRKILRVRPLGKWIEIVCDEAVKILINLGMGGEVLYFENENEIADKAKIIMRFNDDSGFYITLWWFGYFHLVRDGEKNPMTDKLGPGALEISLADFQKILTRKRGGIKSFLLNQKNIRGIGNFYIQEILFRAKIHPLTPINVLSEADIERLHSAIHEVLKRSIALGSSSYELDFFGKKGKYSLRELSFAYHENGVCPDCGAAAQKIKTGANSQYICPQCQVLPTEQVSVEKADFKPTKIMKSL